ncbi:MAG TPA: M48 family metallopeptidase [Terracidiphilus sp.]|nr:M48 family metallopeptidase [Terracidiphilus sp.]
MNRILFVIALCVPLSLYSQKVPKQADVRVQNTSLSRDQEIEIGKQYASQVEREVEVIHNPEVEQWLNQIGQNLARTPQANAYPYYFKLVNDDSINAFALPGGPMYVNTGLLKAADSEGEVAGVLAHEMSHVALRHGAAQITKQQRYGMLFQVIGLAAGTLTTDQNGQCGLICQISQAGTVLGENSLLMKFSRGYEHDADLNGARMMSSAGYDPIQLPKFFEKLEATQGTASEPKGLALWMASHPATGSRISYVSDDIKFYPKREYSTSTGNFPKIKKLMASIPPPKPQPGKLIQSKTDASQRTNLPTGFKDYPANGFSIGYPGTWQAGQAQPGSSLYMIPQDGVAKSQNGGVELLSGAMIDYYVPQAGASAVRLDVSTKEFLASLQKGDTNLKTEKSEHVQLGGKTALRTKLTTKTSLQTEPDQVVYLYTVSRDAGLWYLVLATQPSKLGELDPVFKQITGTVQFPD